MIFEFLSPYLGWIIAAISGVVAIVLGVGKIKSDGKKEGVQQERARQTEADIRARDVVDDVRDEVRSIPNTETGKAERNERANRWVKH